MPRYSGPRVVVETPAGTVSEPLRADVEAQLARMAPLSRDCPDAVWRVDPGSAA